MKTNKILIILLSFTFIICSCDKKAVHEYFMKNNCEETIIVEILDYHNKFSSIEIIPSVEKLVYYGETINSVYEDEITYFIKDIKIKKGDVMLNKNLLDYTIWHYEQITQFKAKSYMVIYPEDFE